MVSGCTVYCALGLPIYAAKRKFGQQSTLILKINHSQSHVKTEQKADNIPKQQHNRALDIDPDNPNLAHPRLLHHRIHPQALDVAVPFGDALTKDGMVRLAQEGDADGGGDAVEAGDDDEDPFDADGLRDEAAGDGADDGADKGAPGV